MPLTVERLRKLLHYNPRTGVFTRLVPPRNLQKLRNTRAGMVNRDGYRKIKIDGRAHFAARLAVLYVTGRSPTGLVKHKNEIRSDDRWRNLREVTRTQHNQLRLRHTRRIELPMGVRLNANGRYGARLRVNHRMLHLGGYPTPEKARQAYIAARQKHFGHLTRKESNGNRQM